MIPKHVAQNFNEMQRASANGDLALLETTHKATGRVAFLICGVQRHADKSVELVPIGELFASDPRGDFDPPKPLCNGIECEDADG